MEEIDVDKELLGFLADFAARYDTRRGVVAGRQCVLRTWVNQNTGAIRGEVEIEGTEKLIVFWAELKDPN